MINKIFIPKDNLSIPTQIVPTTKLNLLTKASIDINSVPTDKDGNYLIIDETDKLNLTGVHFEGTNT